MKCVQTDISKYPLLESISKYIQADCLFQTPRGLMILNMSVADFPSSFCHHVIDQHYIA